MKLADRRECTWFQYDKKGHLISVAHPDGTVTPCIRDEQTKSSRLVRPDGTVVTTTDHDGWHEVEEESPEGEQSRVVYVHKLVGDLKGNLVKRLTGSEIDVFRPSDPSDRTDP